MDEKTEELIRRLADNDSTLLEVKLSGDVFEIDAMAMFGGSADVAGAAVARALEKNTVLQKLELSNFDRE